jgi:YbbR domain-containing protein
LASRGKVLKSLLANWPAKIIALGIAVVIVLFNDLARTDERYFSVRLEIEVADTVMPGEEYPNRARIRLRGNEDEIFAVAEEDIVAVADFTAHTTEGTFRAPVEVRRSGSALEIEALEITVEPLNVVVTLEEKLVTSLDVVPNIVGFPPVGYELSDYLLSPTTVNVEGPRSQMEGVVQVLTEEIDLTGRTEDFSERVRLSKPSPLVAFPGGDVVDFRALIVETRIQSVFERIPVEVVDLNPRLRVVDPVGPATIRVQGKQLDLQGIPASRIGAYVDASGIGESGVYELPTVAQVPSAIVVLSIDPSTVQLSVVEEPGLSEEEAE